MVAGVGLLLAIAGAVALARLGELPEDDPSGEAPPEPADPTAASA